MKQTIGFYDFRNAFQDLRPNNFSWNGLNALFDYFERIEDDSGIEIELDVIAICCEFTEYENIEEFNNEYGEEYTHYNQINDAFIIPINEDSFILHNY